MSHTCGNCGSNVTDHNAVDSALIQCAKILVEHTELNSTIEKLLKVLCEYDKAEYAFIYERDYTTETNELSHVYLSERSTADFMTFKPVTFDARNNFSKSLSEKPYIFLKNSDSTNPDYKICEEHLSGGPNNNMLIIPLSVHEKIVGIVGVINLKQHSEDFTLSLAISKFLGSSLSIKYTKDALKQNEISSTDSEELNHALLKAIEILNITEHEKVVDALLDLICSYYKADRAYSFELDKTNKTFINNYERVNGLEKSCITNLDEVPFDMAYNWVSSLSNNEIFYKKIYDMETSSEEYAFLLSENIIDFALIPLKYKGEIIGAVGIDNPKRSGRNFDLLVAISTLISNNTKE